MTTTKRWRLIKLDKPIKNTGQESGRIIKESETPDGFWEEIFKTDFSKHKVQVCVSEDGFYWDAISIGGDNVRSSSGKIRSWFNKVKSIKFLRF